MAMLIAFRWRRLARLGGAARRIKKLGFCGHAPGFTPILHPHFSPENCERALARVSYAMY